MSKQSRNTDLWISSRALDELKSSGDIHIWNGNKQKGIAADLAQKVDLDFALLCPILIDQDSRILV